MAQSDPRQAIIGYLSGTGGLEPEKRGASGGARADMRWRNARRGIGAKAEIEVSRDTEAVSIPADALRNEGSVNFVYVVAAGKAERRNIVTGAVEGQYVQVLSGLQPGDTVILTGPAALQSGTPVQVVGRG